jgi:hypothetical protein
MSQKPIKSTTISHTHHLDNSCVTAVFQHDDVGIEIVAGTATRVGIAVGNRWGTGTGTGSTVETPAKPVPQLGVHRSPDG